MVIIHGWIRSAYIRSVNIHCNKIATAICLDVFLIQFIRFDKENTKYNVFKM